MTAFLQYVDAKYEAWFREYVFRSYASDALMYTARGMGTKMERRYIDIISTDSDKTPEKTGDEIAADIIARCGLEVRT